MIVAGAAALAAVGLWRRYAAAPAVAPPAPPAAVAATPSPPAPAPGYSVPPGAPPLAAPAPARRRGPSAAERFPQAAVLAERLGPPDAEGVRERIRLLRVDSPWRHVRAEERLYPDGAGGSRAVLQGAMAAEHIIVRLREDAGEDALDAINRRLGGRIERRLTRPGLYVIRFDAFDIDTARAMAARYTRESAALLYAEPDFIVFACDTTPDDPLFSQLWGLSRIGAPRAWDWNTGQGRTVVAVIDSGINALHPDLAGNLWTNPLEIAGNAIDDDDNGYVDDVQGWDFASRDNLPADTVGHGTHTSGTIGAVGHNATGVVGVAWQVRILPLRFLTQLGGLTTDAIDALQYTIALAERGVPLRVSNNSWGGGLYSQALLETIRAAGDAGQLFVAAAGNDGDSNDIFPFYPASYDATNIITVAATDAADKRPSFSNYGIQSVELAAPGVGIVSTLWDDYGASDGTSMAAPHVAGVAALLWDTVPDATWQDVRGWLLDGAETLSNLVNVTIGGRFLSADGALRAITPVITHTPLPNTTNATAPYVLTAAVAADTFLAPGSPRLLWNTTGGETFVTSSLAALSNHLYTASIPAQPVGSTIFYRLEAVTPAGVAAAHPAGNPPGVHAFQVVDPVSLWVEGAPNRYGTADPGYGTHYLPSGITVRASVDALADVTPTQRFACTGWVGIGSVPSGGQTNLATFPLTRASAIEWQWQRQFSLRQQSLPTGLVDTVTWWPAGAEGRTLDAPEQAVAASGTWHFVEWSVEGTRRPAATGLAANPVTGLVMSAAMQAVARYLPDGEDTDADTLDDWWEQRYFGSLAATIDGDEDQDGYRNAEEFADRTNPGDPASVPAGPAILHTPQPDPQPRPAPWPISAVVTDNHAVAAVTLHWRRVPLGWHADPMTVDADGRTYRAAIPTPSSLGDTYEYRLEAVDAAGLVSTTPTYTFRVAYPLGGTAPDALEAVLRPGAVTNLVFALTNSGNTNLEFRVGRGWFEDAESARHPLTHLGTLDSWHRSTNRAWAGSHAWYCGQTNAPSYRNGVYAALELPPLVLQPDARLEFRHWMKAEYDTELNDDHYWDGGVVALSTNGTDFYQITPEGGYPHRIRRNTQSPFPPDLPCYGGTGGWEHAVFDLAAYAGATGTVRFIFGSDLLATEEGWYLDAIVVTHAAPTPDWLSAAPTNGSVAAGAALALTATLDAAGLGGGDHRGLLHLESNDPLAPRRDVPVFLAVRSPPVVGPVTGLQTATNGSGQVTISAAVYDADGEPCDLAVACSTNAGVSWFEPVLLSATGTLGAVTLEPAAVPPVRQAATAVADAPATNTVAVAWPSAQAPHAIGLSTAALARVQAWDGRDWSAPATSAVFLVDNEPPAPVAALQLPGYAPDSWSTTRTRTLLWTPADDGNGGGMGWYLAGVSAGPDAPLQATARFASTGGLATATADGTNWWFGILPVDRFGNTGAVTRSGPVRIDSQPPSPAAAVIEVAGSAGGAYATGSVIHAAWSGFTDNLSGIATYYLAWEDGGGTTNGAAAPASPATLGGATLDTTNTLHVWARDHAGLLGNAATRSLLVLNPESDYDGDGQLTGDEEFAGTDAGQASSVFALQARFAGQDETNRFVILEWPGQTGRWYTIRAGSNLADVAAGWSALGGVSNRPGENGSMVHTDRVDRLIPRFYRLNVTDQPSP